jgi:hypothetical protein
VAGRVCGYVGLACQQIIIGGKTFRDFSFRGGFLDCFEKQEYLTTKNTKVHKEKLKKLGVSSRLGG